ncbi:hypothetical protein [Paenibacillus kribbensis]|uniref:hypothetical protein n=1 Tax=Paenibacillus kribbensis TaxID=172713 RepID=UPI00210E45CD|nr:hypothetical protein [Paenibacillus kribbensis]
MKKTLLASLGLGLILSSSAGAVSAEKANPVPVTKESTLASVVEYNEQEPNDSFEQANEHGNYYFIGDAVVGTLGKEVQGSWEAYDVFKIMASRSNEILFTIQGDKYPDLG